MTRKRPTQASALSYLQDVARDLPGATPKEMRAEIRRRLRRDGYGWGWIVVVLKILAALAPLLFKGPGTGPRG